MSTSKILQPAGDGPNLAWQSLTGSSTLLDLARERIKDLDGKSCNMEGEEERADHRRWADPGVCN
jgi:hypothetical protein